jgi:hypothetical protein
MSYTSLKSFDATGLRTVKRYQNSHGFAPKIWNSLCERYFPHERWAMGAWELLWKDKSLVFQPWERIVLRSTYDRAAVKAEDVPQYIEALGLFDKFYTKPDHVNHLLSIAADAQQLLGTEGFRALCFTGSLSDDLWEVREPCTNESCEGDHSECDPEIRPYDLDRDQGHWFVSMEGL